MKSGHIVAARVLALVALIVSTVGCGAPTSPSPGPLPGSSNTPTPPVPTPPPAPVGTGIVSGTVIDFTAAGEGRAVPNLRLRVRAAHSDLNGAVGGLDLPDVTTDAQGRYTVSGIPGWLIFLQTDRNSDYRTLCDSYPIIVNSLFKDLLKDLPVVHRSWSGNRPPPGMELNFTSVYGTVSELTSEGPQPLAGATVTLGTGNQDPPATTTDTGFYAICSIVGTDQIRSMSAQKSGYHPAVRQIFGGWDSEAHFELTRR